MNNYEKIGDTILIELPEEVDDYRAAGLVEETEDAFLIPGFVMWSLTLSTQI